MEGERALKVLVLGDCNTGKTSLIKRCKYDTYSTKYNSTVGVDFTLKIMKRGNESVRLQLWDIAGQDRFGTIARVYYRDAHGALLVYDVTQKKTFENVIKWKREIDEKVELDDGSPIPVLLLGNKCDLEASEVDTSALDQFCIDHNFVSWMETSAKADTNVQAMADRIVDAIITRLKAIEAKKGAGQLPPSSDPDEGVDVAGGSRDGAEGGSDAGNGRRRKKGCC